MNVPTVLEQPALPVELSATLELTADFARRHRRRKAAYGAIVRIGVKPIALGSPPLTKCSQALLGNGKWDSIEN
jgi:hypothetical protein